MTTQIDNPTQTQSQSQSHLAPSRVDEALLLVRIALGLPFLYHGSAILFGAFGGPGLQGFASFGHMPIAVAFLVGLAQFAGGLAVLTGVLTRLGGVCIAIVMLGAIFIVHLPHGFDTQKGGFEYPLALFLMAVALIVAGAGRYTLASVLPADLVRRFTRTKASV